MRDGFIKVYDGTNWVLKDRKEIIDDLHNDNKCLLVEKFEELQKMFPDYTIRKFGRYMKSDDKLVEPCTKKEINMLLYNNNKIPLKTKKKKMILLKINK